MEKKLFIIILFITISVMTGYAQLVAIGHMSAEVVEPASITSKAVTDFEVQVVTNGSMDLGEIRVISGGSVDWNVVVKPATLSNNRGDSFTIELVESNEDLCDSQKRDGVQTLRLSADASELEKRGMYRGSYAVILSYN